MCGYSQMPRAAFLKLFFRITLSLFRAQDVNHDVNVIENLVIKLQCYCKRVACHVLCDLAGFGPLASSVQAGCACLRFWIAMCLIGRLRLCRLSVFWPARCFGSRAGGDKTQQGGPLGILIALHYCRPVAVTACGSLGLYNSNKCKQSTPL